MDIRIKEVINNLKNYDFDILGNYKMDGAEAKKLIEAIEETDKKIADYTYTIGLLQDRIEEIEKSDKWIPVSERMPKNNEDVLVCYEDGHVETAYYYIDTDIYLSEYEDCCETGWYNYNEDFMYNQDVIAWMPLPASFEPQEGVNKE